MNPFKKFFLNMSETKQELGTDLLKMATQIVSSYVAKNAVELADLQEIIRKTYQALLESHEKTSNHGYGRNYTPAVPIDESVTDEYIVCLEDGKKLQMLRRHLSTVYSMTPEEYKEKWGLAPDYPIVSPSYARRRSEIARETGLGHTNRKKDRSVEFSEDGTQIAVVSRRNKIAVA